MNLASAFLPPSLQMLRILEPFQHAQTKICGRSYMQWFAHFFLDGGGSKSFKDVPAKLAGEKEGASLTQFLCMLVGPELNFYGCNRYAEDFSFLLFSFFFPYFLLFEFYFSWFFLVTSPTPSSYMVHNAMVPLCS